MTVPPYHTLQWNLRLTVCINNLKLSIIENLGEPLHELSLPHRQRRPIGKPRALITLAAKEKCYWRINRERLLVNLRLLGDRRPTGMPGWQESKEAPKLPGLLERQRALETAADAKIVPS